MFATIGCAEMMDSLKSRRRYFLGLSFFSRRGVSHDPFKAALIARENAPASTPGTRFRYSSLQIPVAPRVGQVRLHLHRRENKSCRGLGTAAVKRLCRCHLVGPRKAHAEVQRVPLSALLLLRSRLLSIALSPPIRYVRQIDSRRRFL